MSGSRSAFVEFFLHIRQQFSVKILDKYLKTSFSICPSAHIDEAETFRGSVAAALIFSPMLPFCQAQAKNPY
jgi:hypothetical protein